MDVLSICFDSLGTKRGPARLQETLSITGL
jgi:hypothetical protein